MKARIRIPNTCISFQKYLLFLYVSFLFLFSSVAVAAQLAPGDIAFTGYNAITNWAGDNNIRFTLGYPLITNTIASGTWNETSTWDNGIPGKITEATISHSVTVTADCAIHSGVIAPGGHLGIHPEITFACNEILILQSDDAQSGSLIPDGTLAAEVSCERYLCGGRWHLVAPPVSGQEIASFLTDAVNNIP